MTIEEENIVPKDRSLVGQSQPVRKVERFYSNPLLQRMADDLLDRHENYGDGVKRTKIILEERKNMKMETYTKGS